MAQWTTTIARMPRLKLPAVKLPVRAQLTRTAAFPLCNLRGGLCDTLLSAIPMSIIGIQFIRDDNDVVQDGMVIFANDYAEQVFGRIDDTLVGTRFIASCQDMLLAGIWQRCLWVAAHGNSETMIEQEDANSDNRKFLTIAPYGDGLILCRSIEQSIIAEDVDGEMEVIG
jgi:hypothetical protein